MNNKGSSVRVILFVGLLCSILFAQKPVRIDEILTQTKSFRLDTTLSYANIQSSSNLSASQTFQTQNGDVVTVPVFMGASKSNRDYLNIDLTLRYGMTKDIEIFASVNGYSSDTKYTLPQGLQNSSDNGFNALGIGVTYQIKPEDETPSLLVGASTQIIEKSKMGEKSYTNHFKNYRLYATSFYSVDPVVFLLSASYSFNQTKKIGASKRDDADILTLSPQVYFAVNPYTSLNWGVKYSYFGKTKIDNSIIGNSGSNLAFVTGVSYEFSAKTFININTEFLNTNSLSQNSFSLTVSHKF